MRASCAHCLNNSLDFGDNFRFGARAAGDTATLTSMGQELGFDVEVLPLVSEEVPGDDDGVWSSTRIRESLRHGCAREAASLLGHHPYRELPADPRPAR